MSKNRKEALSASLKKVIEQGKVVYVSEKTDLIYILKAVILSSKGTLSNEKIHEITTFARKGGDAFYKLKFCIDESDFFNESCFYFEVYIPTQCTFIERMRNNMSIIKTAALNYIGINTVRVIIAK